ncbi:MAG: NACHT domain-containing protein [Leptolyngbya sp. SIO3F4]|nr:NACHT domain-containing protein [Leptolyngbya sp. SIO3F4]
MVAQVKKEISINAKLVYALETDQRMLQINRDGAKGFQTLVEGGVANIGTHYHLAEPEKFKAALEAILIATQSSYAKNLDFKLYLRSIVDADEYREWQDVYTPTTVEGPKQSSQKKLSPKLKLRVEAVKSLKNNSGSRGAKEPERNEQVEEWDVLVGLRQNVAKHKHVLLIGKPGSGKSTSLERLLWEEADTALKTSAVKIPVLVKLRRCTSTLEHLIQDFFNCHQLPLKVTDIEHLLQQGKLFLLLDGLNELPEAFRTEVANFRDRNRKTTPMIVSTRALSTGGTLGIIQTLKMLPLTELQMQEFVNGYLGKEGNRLFHQLKGDRLRKFAETPLLLWMLCRVFALNGKVPANLGLAFREFTQLYDQQLQADAPAKSRDQWFKLLRHLAFALMQDKDPVKFRLSMPREEAEALLTDCLQQEGRNHSREFAERWLQDLMAYHLLQPVKQPNFEEHIEFRHQLIQEYYAAEYLLRLLPGLSDEELKRDYLNYLKWTETLKMVVLLLETEESLERIVRLARKVDVLLEEDLLMSIRPDIFKNSDVFNQSLSREHSTLADLMLYPEGASLPDILDLNKALSRAIENAYSSFDNTLPESDDVEDTSIYSDLVEKIKSFQGFQPFKRHNQAINRGALDLIGELVKILTQARPGSRIRFNSLIEDLDSYDVTKRRLAVHKISSNKTYINLLVSSGLVERLIYCLNDINILVKEHTRSTLKRIDKPEPFIKLIEYSDTLVRRTALEELGRFRSKRVTQILVELVDKGDFLARRFAALGLIGSVLIYSPRNNFDRWRTPQQFVIKPSSDSALSYPPIYSIVGWLALLQDPHADIRVEAIKLWEKYPLSVAVPVLISMLQDHEKYHDWGEDRRKEYVCDVAQKILLDICEKHTIQEIESYLSYLKQILPYAVGNIGFSSTDGFTKVYRVISQIQSRCLYYDYDFYKN